MTRTATRLCKRPLHPSSSRRTPGVLKERPDMFRFLRPVLLSTFLFFGALAPQASAQVVPPALYSYENPYLPPQYAPAYGGYATGTVLSGTADVIHAQGDLLLQEQQARIL